MKKLDFRFRGNDEAHKCAWALCRRELSVSVVKGGFAPFAYQKETK